ncbi:MAG: histidinol-phosphate transaminase [Armatimonadetes bacterium]|nr:histidinol-phosphate transaminase [Armatimonadota bacterium]
MCSTPIQALIRPCVQRIVPYSPGKPTREVQEELGPIEVVKLASNENPLGPSPQAIEAMCRAASEVHIYPDPACTELTRALARKWDVDPDGVVVGRGSDELIHMLGLAFVNPGDEVVYSDPPFSLYPFTADLMDAKHVPVPAVNFKHDLRGFAEAITDRTKLVFIANPYNPTGTINTAEEVAELMERVPDTCIVVFDEAYYEYVDDPAYPDTLQYVREGRRVVVLRTFSKAYALAGLRIGYGLMPPEIAQALRQVREPFNVSSLAQAAALASLADEEQVVRSRKMVLEGREYLYRELDKLGLEYVPTRANFIFIDAGVDSRALFNELMRRGVTVRTGDIFGYPTYIRTTIGTPEQNERFIAALVQALQALGVPIRGRGVE